jgi:hypothetical protein
MVPSPSSDIQFPQAGHIVEHITLSANNEKNTAKTISTDRHFADDNCADIPLASIVKSSLYKLHLSDGPMLRESPNSLEPAGKLFWHSFLNFFCEVMSLNRPSYGMQSFRRGYAMALRNIGHLSTDELQCIGYWWSGAVNTYAGSAMGMRLNLQRKPEHREAYGDLTVSRSGAGGQRRK